MRHSPEINTQPISQTIFKKSPPPPQSIKQSNFLECIVLVYRSLSAFLKMTDNVQKVRKVILKLQQLLLHLNYGKKIKHLTSLLPLLEGGPEP